MTTETIEDKAATALNEKIIEMEANFRKVETFLMAARNFIAAHADKLTGLYWRCWGWSEEVVIGLHGDVRDPKEIARRFGSDGWTREADSSTCGQFHWIKTVDGVRIKIEGAEQLKPTINQTVRL